MVDTFRCLNCGKEVREDQAKLFAQVYVCSECFAMAEGAYRRIEKDLKQLLVLAHESIREALVQGKLHQISSSSETSTKAELLRSLLLPGGIGDEVHRNPTV